MGCCSMRFTFFQTALQNIVANERKLRRHQALCRRSIRVVGSCFDRSLLRQARDERDHADERDGAERGRGAGEWLDTLLSHLNL